MPERCVQQPPAQAASLRRDLDVETLQLLVARLGVGLRKSAASSAELTPSPKASNHVRFAKSEIASTSLD